MWVATAARHRSAEIRKLDRVVIRFAGDSGDGMQLTGDRFTSEAAAFGNDLATLPNFPAEIRAPQGTLPGVSSFQLHFADYDILTPGDRPDVLVAMNPAALKANIGDLPPGGMLIVNTDEFTKRNLAKVGYEANPLEDDSLDRRSRCTRSRWPPSPRARWSPPGWARRTPSGRRTCSRSACCPGCTTGRPRAPSGSCGRSSPASPTSPRRTCWRSGRAGTTARPPSRSRSTYQVAPAKLATGTYRQITGNTALAYGIVAAGQRSKLPILLGTYPITPASDILHELSKHKNFGITTFQAEDEIAGIGAALGASYGGALGMTTTSGPGYRAEVRDHRARRDDRAAADRDRRAARRPVHRSADQDRAGRPVAGHVRPQRRGPGADRRAAQSPADCFPIDASTRCASR